MKHYLLQFLAIAAGILCAPAATMSVRLVVLDEPYLWQGTYIDSSTGEIDDKWGSTNIDVDGDGADDLGFFTAGAGDLLVLASFEAEILVRRISGPNDPDGLAARFDEGTLVGPGSISAGYTYSAISPHSHYYNPPTREELGDYYDNYDTPLPRDVIVTGSLSPGAADLWKGQSGYLGFRTLEDDGWHYGWVYIEKDPLLTVTGGYVTAFGYETEPNKAILASIPEPAAGVLALLAIYPLLGRRVRKGARPFTGVVQRHCPPPRSRAGHPWTCLR